MANKYQPEEVGEEVGPNSTRKEHTTKPTKIEIICVFSLGEHGNFLVKAYPLHSSLPSYDVSFVYLMAMVLVEFSQTH